VTRHDLGWCHNCETLQRLEDAPVLWVGYLDKELPCCGICGADEPWDDGVWPAAGWVPELFCMPCLLRACVERWSGYPGDLRCEHGVGKIEWSGAIVYRGNRVLGHSRSGGHAERGRVDRVENVPLRLLRSDEYDDLGGGMSIVRADLRAEMVPLCQICFRGRAQHAVRWKGQELGE
jgi:hypothetical protein